jgi:hypothetical protein
MGGGATFPSCLPTNSHRSLPWSTSAWTALPRRHGSLSFLFSRALTTDVAQREALTFRVISQAHLEECLEPPTEVWCFRRAVLAVHTLGRPSGFIHFRRASGSPLKDFCSAQQSLSVTARAKYGVCVRGNMRNLEGFARTLCSGTASSPG